MNDLTGTHHLVRLLLRRDRIRLPGWVIGLTVLTAASASAVQGLYDTAEKIAGYGATVTDSAAGKLFNGTPYGVDELGGIVSYEVSATAGVVVSLMVIFLVVRHTRGEEESGAAELLRSTVLGRHAASAATLLVAGCTLLLVGALDALVLMASGLPMSGSVLHGAALCGLGLSFTAVATAAAQVTSSSRGAVGISLGFLALFFVIRGVGAVTDSRIVWLSPFGWQEGVRVFDQDRLWPLALFVVFTAVVFGGAARLTARRDFGAGLVQPRGGDPRASQWLRGPLGLAFVTQRGMTFGWAAGLVLMSGLFGAVGKEVVGMVQSNPDIIAVFGDISDDVLRGFFSFAVSFLGVLTSAYAISSAMRLRQEETAGRAEAVLATGVSRTSWVTAQVALTTAGTFVLLLVCGLVMGGTHGLVSGDWGLVWPLTGAALATAPGVLVLAALVVLLAGVLPRWVLLGWIGFAFALLQAYLGDLLDLPDLVAGLSPFWHLSLLPAESWDPVPTLVVSGLAVLLTAVGMIGWRRRDIGS